MNTLDKFLEQYQKSFEIDRFMSPAMLSLGTTSPPSSLFKYFPSDRAEFFQRPLIRFTHRSGLNDPFELMQRWHEFADDAIKAAILENMQGLLAEFKQHNGVLLQIFKEQQAKRGVFLSPEQIAQAAQVFFTEDGRRHLVEIFANANEEIPALVHAMFEQLNQQSESMVLSLTSNIGILSLSENPTHRAMWSLYASAGKGFLVEFDATHPFFKTKGGESQLYPVAYSDEFGQSFFENPMALFLTKHTDYRFEQEWRMLKLLSQCDEVIAGEETQMHMCEIPRGAIRSVTFGYAYGSAFAVDAATIKILFDEKIKIRMLRANRKTGTFDFFDLDEAAQSLQH